jgi:hypothetical protein
LPSRTILGGERVLGLRPQEPHADSILLSRTPRQSTLFTLMRVMRLYGELTLVDVQETALFTWQPDAY